MLLAWSFLQDHAGYRLKRLLAEAIGEAERQFAKASHTWQEVVDFGNLYNSGDLNRSLWLLTRNNGLAVPGSITTMLFHYREPILRLRPSDQELLLAALDGMTDKELSHRLRLNLGTIKKRWVSLFERVANVKPALLPEVNGADNSHKRGAQKRHRLLAYVREHPEELRPFGNPHWL